MLVFPAHTREIQHEGANSAFVSTSDIRSLRSKDDVQLYEGWNFNSGNYLFTTDTK